jgi:hypothetical protein
VSRRNIAYLLLPQAQYRVDRVSSPEDGSGGFETQAFARAQDAKRAKRLRKAVRRYADAIDADHAMRLAAQLEHSGETGDSPDSLASSVYMRTQRIRVIGALWALMMGSAT